MTTNIDRAVEIIGQHVKCGWSICERRRRSEDGKFPPLDACGNTNPSCRDVAEGIAQDLADAGILAPDLPSDNADGMGSGEWSAGFEYEGYSDGNLTAIHQAHASAWAPGWISLSAPRRMTTDQAEAVALALLAAVRSDRQIAAHATQEKK